MTDSLQDCDFTLSFMFLALSLGQKFWLYDLCLTPRRQTDSSYFTDMRIYASIVSYMKYLLYL